MNKVLLMIVSAALFSFSTAQAEKVHDWHDLDAVHKHVLEAIKEMDHARAANHYDMDGHGAKAEQALHEAEHELAAAVESAKHAK